MWVKKEIQYWIKERKASSKILLVVSEGDIVWDTAKVDFDWERSTAVPDNLKAAFSNEPKWVDLRWARKVEHLSLSDGRFRDNIADLAATLHGRPKDEIAGEEVQQHRRTVKWAWTVGITLLLLSIVAGSFAFISEHRRREAVANLLIFQSNAALATNPSEALRLALAAWRMQQNPDVHHAVLTVLLQPRCFSDHCRRSHEYGIRNLGFMVQRILFAGQQDNPFRRSQGARAPSTVRRCRGRRGSGVEGDCYHS
jgi:hypothetical protein